MCLETVIFSCKSTHNHIFNHIKVYFLKEWCALLYYPSTLEPMAWPFHQYSGVLKYLNIYCKINVYEEWCRKLHLKNIQYCFAQFIRN